MSHNMGMGKLSSAEMVFVRKFRFIISSENLENWFIHSVDVDLYNNQLTIRFYEILANGVILAHTWADAMQKREYPDEKLTLLALDGCGTELYKRVFTGLQINGRKNSFNYDSSDVSFTEVSLHYDKCEYSQSKDVHHEWHPEKPRETEVNHLNAKISIV